MRKALILLLFLALTVNCFADNQWRGGSGEDTILGTESPSDIDARSFEDIVDPLDRLLSTYKQGAKIVYATAATLTIEAGSVVVSNSAGDTRLMVANTSSTTVTWSDIDTGSEAVSTTYYVYAYQDTTTNATFDIVISTSSSTPTGVTYYARLGSFYNNASGDIEQIENDDMTNVKVVTGTVAHGGTISLPSGYVQAQCDWMVSGYSLRHSDRDGSHSAGFDCYANSSRVVTCQGIGQNVGAGSPISGTANYIIIGSK